MNEKIRKRMLCWTSGQMVASGGPFQRSKVYQNGKQYHQIGMGSGYVILRQVS